MAHILLLLGLWVTEKLIYPIDSTTVTLPVFVLMLLPLTGFLTWKQVESGPNWGTLIVFAIGISLGKTS